MKKVIIDRKLFDRILLEISEDFWKHIYNGNYVNYYDDIRTTSVTSIFRVKDFKSFGVLFGKILNSGKIKVTSIRILRKNLADNPLIWEQFLAKTVVTNPVNCMCNEETEGFLVDNEELRSVMEEVGEEIIGFFHVHPHPSDEVGFNFESLTKRDRYLIKKSGNAKYLTFVIYYPNGEFAGIKGFFLRGGNIRGVEIVIENTEMPESPFLSPALVIPTLYDEFLGVPKSRDFFLTVRKIIREVEYMRSNLGKFRILIVGGGSGRVELPFLIEFLHRTKIDDTEIVVVDPSAHLLDSFKRKILLLGGQCLNERCNKLMWMVGENKIIFIFENCKIQEFLEGDEVKDNYFDFVLDFFALHHACLKNLYYMLLRNKIKKGGILLHSRLRREIFKSPEMSSARIYKNICNMIKIYNKEKTAIDFSEETSNKIKQFLGNVWKEIEFGFAHKVSLSTLRDVFALSSDRYYTSFIFSIDKETRQEIQNLLKGKSSKITIKQRYVLELYKK